MDEQKPQPQQHSYNHPVKLVRQHKLVTLLTLSITTAFLMVMMALNLYNSSGAAQLDMSRPGFQTVRKEASHDDEISSYPASGPLTKEAVSQFKAKYDAQSKKITEANAFAGDPLSDKSLGLDGANDASGITATE